MSIILLVGDGPDAGADFRRLVARDGHVVHVEPAGPDILGRVKALRPHLVALDIRLVDAEGCPVCRALRADSIAARIPVLILAHRELREEIRSGLKDGADDYVAPDEAEEVILARVDRLTKYRKFSELAFLNHQLTQVGLLVAGIVHEIRSPLAVIRGHAELLRMLHPDNPDIAECVAPILRNSLLLQSRLDHLMAAIRSGESTPRPIPLGPIVVESTELFKKGVDPRQSNIVVTVEIGDPARRALVDPGRLMQVILNLLANAQESIQSTRTTGRIEIRIVQADEPGWLTIEVSDDGPGIPPESLNRIFEPFYTTKPGGNGFGLYLAREIIRDQGGRLNAYNHPSHGGACFSISLLEASDTPVA